LFLSHTPYGNSGTSCPLDRGVWQKTNRDSEALKLTMMKKWLIHER
jgi:hypothetical protein